MNKTDFLKIPDFKVIATNLNRFGKKDFSDAYLGEVFKKTDGFEDIRDMVKRFRLCFDLKVSARISKQRDQYLTIYTLEKTNGEPL